MKFLLQTQIGIEKITELELLDIFKKDHSIDYVGYIPQKNGIVQIEWKDEHYLQFYNELGTIEDAFFVLDYVKDIDIKYNLKTIYQKINLERIRKNLDFFFDKVNPFDNAKRFRFVTRKKAGNEFRRIDLENSIKDLFDKKFQRVEVTDEEGVKEIWTTLVKNRLIIAIRLTTKEKRHRYYKTEAVHGSLRPTVAYAMAYVAEPHAKDTIWDPFCGAGTIGCELSEKFKFNRLILSDISEEATTITKTNLTHLTSFKKTKSKISIRQEDFFSSKSFADMIISNLPFGHQYSTNADFINHFFQKLKATPHVRKVALLYPNPIEGHADWQLTRKFQIRVLGREAWLMVLQRRQDK
ncbi:MAG: TRM11 family SAM-dependent methyltransferase [Candidatus Dojkabacteria bacterium]